jgi:hypothetical protein
MFKKLTMFHRQPLVAGLIALGLAIVSQHVLQSRQPTAGLIGYLIALFIGLPALRHRMPEGFGPDAATMATSQPFTLPKFNLQFLRPDLKQRDAIVTLSPATAPAAKDAPPRSPGFFTHWRYYTLADILAGRQPNIPIVSAPPSSLPDAIPTPLDSPAPTTVMTPVGSAEPAISPTRATSQVMTPEAAVQKWTDFVKPQAVFISPEGHVLVLDTGQNILFRYDPQGNLTGQWSVPKLPSPNRSSYALTPDGKTLYVADPAHHCVHVIALT